ncbi:MAG TPA: VanZ family protein [Candidatus Acidoferrales bacterium]|nr:VanZ family protein [Candidatus Acidoferrales bacterium]
MNWLKRWWPALAWAVVISGFSTGVFTAEHTSRIIIPILHWLLPHARNSTLYRIHHIIRKCAHFTEYFILSLLILRGIRAGRPGARFAWALAAIAIVACYASLDELHQHFVPGRTAAVGDVLIDTTGGIAGQAVAALLMLWGHVRQKRKQQADLQTGA